METVEQLEQALEKARSDLARSSTTEETERAYRAIYRLQDEIAHRPKFPPWQPIETAPKDGRTILLWDGFSVFTGFWNGHWVTDESLSARPWTKAWMPLPEPPR